MSSRLWGGWWWEGPWRAHRSRILGVLDEVSGIEQLILHGLQGTQPQGPHLLLHSPTQPLQHLQHREKPEFQRGPAPQHPRGETAGSTVGVNMDRICWCLLRSGFSPLSALPGPVTCPSMSGYPECPFFLFHPTFSLGGGPHGSALMPPCALCHHGYAPAHALVAWRETFTCSALLVTRPCCSRKACSWGHVCEWLFLTRHHWIWRS